MAEPWKKYKAETVSEGGPWSKYGQITPREVVDALPAFMTRTPDEKAEVRRNAANRALVGALPETDSAIGKVGTFSGQYLNSSTFGQIDNLNAAFDTVTGTNGFTGQTFSGSKAQHRDNRQELREANPIAGIVGDIGGYLAPGTAAWNSLAAAGKAIPGAARLATAISSTGRVPGWLQRIGGSIGLFTADAAVFGATVGTSNEEATAGRDLTLSERGKTGVDYAKANLGEMADGLGVDVPSWARSIPVSVVFPVAGSVTERSIKGVTSGGKTITPDRVQAEVLNSVGRAPAQSAAREMAEVIDAGPVSSGSIKTFRFIENALRDAGEAAGFSKDAIRNRIATGFESIRKALPTSADGRTPLAVLVEREFADDFGPVVAENLRKFLLRVGLDDAGVTRRFIDDLRQTQVDDFRNMVDDNLGSQSAIDFEDAVEAGIQKKVQSRQAVVDKAKEVGNHGPFADSLREHLAGSEFKGMLAGEAKQRGWKDVDTFIDQDPWNAANKLQSELGRAESKAFNAGNTQTYSKMLESKEWIQDFLGRSDNTGLPGYNRLTGQIAAESRVRDNIGYTDGFGKKHPGFGSDLKEAARSERDTAQMVKRYKGDTPQDRAAVARLPNKQARDRTLERTQAAARISTGEVLKDQLRGARPGGVNAQGQDVVGLRLADLQTVGMMDALRNVFSDAGDNIADGVNQLVNRRQFLADIDPRTGSNTTNKQNALATGDEAFTGGLGRSINTNALSDVMLFANGLPPVVSMIRDAPEFVKRLAGPGRAQRTEIANALLQLPQRTGPAPASPAAMPKLTGHSNPNWKNDPRWNEPNLTGRQSPPSEAGYIRPEMLGSLPVRSAIGAAGGAYIDEENPARGAATGAAMLGLGPKAARMADDIITSPSARRVLDGSSEAGFSKPGRTSDTIYAKSGRKYSMAEGSTMSKVIELARQGKTNTQIDEALGLSPGVAAHYRNVAKTGKPPVDLSPQSLPMDEASRMARARELGFDTEQTLYHGTTKNVPYFKRGNSGAMFATDAPQDADMFARGGPWYPDDAPFPDGANTMPVYARGKFLDINSPEAEALAQKFKAEFNLPGDTVADLLGTGQYIPERVRFFLQDAGYDGISRPGNKGTSYAVFQPENLRSKYATFDPAQSESPVLTAGIGGRRGNLPMKGDAKQGGSTTTDRAVDAATLGVASGGFVGPADAEGVNYEAEFAAVEQDLQRAQGERQATLQRLQAAQDELAAWNARFNGQDRDVKAIQTFLRDNVNPDLAVDGDPRGQTATANQQYISRLEQAIIAQQEALAKNDEMVQSAEKRRADLENRQVYDQTAPNPAWDFVREKLPWVGAAAGIYAGYRTRGGTMRKARQKAEAVENQVEGLLKPSRGKNALSKDSHAVNEMHELGGSGPNVPFDDYLTGPKQGQPRARPNAAEIASLFPKASQNWSRADIAGSALWGLEGTAGTVGMMYSDANLQAAETRLRQLEDAPEKDLAAIKKARSDVEFWKSAKAISQASQMLGIYGAGINLAKGAVEKLPTPQPNKKKIADMRSSVAQRIQKRDEEYRHGNR